MVKCTEITSKQSLELQRKRLELERKKLQREKRVNLLCQMMFVFMMTVSLSVGNVTYARKVGTLPLPELTKVSEHFLAYEVYDNLEFREGSGDYVTNVETGNLGVTKAAVKASGATKGTPDTDIALLYLIYLEGKWERVKGYSDAPKPVKLALLDSSYNLGEGVMKYRGVGKPLQDGNYIRVMQALLSSANVKGKSLRGLAKRRAELYNQVGLDKITEIEQREDGTILYKGSGGTLFEYTPLGGKHEKSDVGTITMPDTDQLQFSRYD